MKPIILICLATAAIVSAGLAIPTDGAESFFLGAPEPEKFTGLICYTNEPEEAIAGTSTCKPCNLFFSNLKAYIIKGTSWKFGLTERRRDGQWNNIVVKTAPEGMDTPTFWAVRDGKKVGEYVGYGPGELNKVLDLYPLGRKAVLPRNWLSAVIPEGGSSKARGGYSGGVEVAQCGVTYIQAPPACSPVTMCSPITVDCSGGGVTYIRTLPPAQYPVPPIRYGAPPPIYRAPGPTRNINYKPIGMVSTPEIIAHLSREHGYSVAYLSGLSRAQLITIHDNSHNGGGGGIGFGGGIRYGAAPYRAPAPYYAPGVSGSYGASNGFHLFGVPIAGTYSRGYASGGITAAPRYCPNGTCPR